MPVQTEKLQRRRKLAGRILFMVGLVLLGVTVVLLRLATVTDYAYHALVKDPERTAPAGPVIVAPADGVVLYVKEIRDGVIPEVVKRGVRVPVVDHLKEEPPRPIESGFLIGIFMNTHGVHVNRSPVNGVVERQVVFNGPHMEMTSAELEVILRQLIPGRVALRKLFRLPPFDLEDKADFVLHSARETLILRDERDSYVYVVRIADYYVGKILTWVREGGPVERGEKIGMITWGSQTDILFESTPGTEVKVEPGDYVYAGETVLATY